jgi:hypothetical protein
MRIRMFIMRTHTMERCTLIERIRSWHPPTPVVPTRIPKHLASFACNSCQPYLCEELVTVALARQAFHTTGPPLYTPIRSCRSTCYRASDLHT